MSSKTRVEKECDKAIKELTVSLSKMTVRNRYDTLMQMLTDYELASLANIEA